MAVGFAYTVDEIKEMLIKGYSVCPAHRRPEKKSTGLYLKRYIALALLIVVGTVLIFEYAEDVVLVIVNGCYVVAGVAGMIHTTVKLVNSKKDYESAMSRYQKSAYEHEQDRRKFVDLVNAGKYYKEEKVVDSLWDKSDFDAPGEYYINNTQVSHADYQLAEKGDTLCFYKVKGYNVCLIVLKKRTEGGKEYVIRQVY